MMTSVNMIWAQCRDRVIGIDGKIPVRIPADMAQFVEKTRGKCIVMGRKTWESLPDAYHESGKGRRNHILSTQAAYVPGRDGVVIRDLHEFIKDVEDSEVWIIGGGEIFEQFIGLADRLYVTEVDMTAYYGDTKAPTIAPEYWNITHRGRPQMHRMPNGRQVVYSFKTYSRKKLHQP